MNGERVIQEILRRVHASAGPNELDRALPNALLFELVGSPDALEDLAGLLQLTRTRYDDLLTIVFRRAGRQLAHELIPDLVTARIQGRPLSLLEARALAFVQSDRDLGKEYSDLVEMIRLDQAGEFEVDRADPNWRQLGDGAKGYGRIVIIEIAEGDDLHVASAERGNLSRRKSMPGNSVQVIDKTANLSLELEYKMAPEGNIGMIVRRSGSSADDQPLSVALLERSGRRRVPRCRAGSFEFDSLSQEASLLCVTYGPGMYRIPIQFENQAAQLFEIRLFLQRYREILLDVLNEMAPADRNAVIEAYGFEDVGFKCTAHADRSKLVRTSNRALLARSRFGKALQQRLAEVITSAPKDHELLGPMLAATSGAIRLAVPPKS